MDTVLPMPVLVITIKILLHGSTTCADVLDILALGLGILCLILYSLFTLIFKKLYLIRIDNDGLLPWATLDSRDSTFRYILKLSFAIYHNLDFEFHSFMSKYLHLITLVVVIFLYIVNTHSMMNPPSYRKEVHYVRTVTYELCSSWYFCIFLKSLNPDFGNRGLIFFMIIAPVFFIIGNILIRYFWELYVMNVKSGKQWM